MAAYGVGGPAWRPLEWSWAARRLIAARNYWLVTASATGRPHALPVWGVWDDAEHRFAFSCAPSSRKARNLAANDHVVFAPEDTVECVSVEGRAQVVTRESRQREWVRRYVAKYASMSPDLSAEFILANALFEVVPERAFGIVEREEEFAERATRWTF